MVDLLNNKPRNKFEKKIYRQLKKAKIRFLYEGIKIPYVLARHYIPDFIITTPKGKIYVETKGYLRPDDRRKLVAVKRQNPGMDIRIVFYDRRLVNVNWAIKNGFKYAIGSIPEEWTVGL